MNDPIVVTRELVKRGWSDIEPKLVTALASGAATAFLVGVAKAYGITIPEQVISAAPLFAALLIGYLTPSVGTTVTKKLDSNGTQVEKHSGSVITTVTASTPVQQATQVIPSARTLADLANTEVMQPPTVQVPSQAAAILDQLPSAQPTPTPAGDKPAWMQ